jgi:PDZ domain-containing protein
VALFTDREPDFRPHRTRRTWVGWLILLVAIAGVTTIAFIPAPYVIEQPGPVFNTLGNVDVSGKQVPMIDVPASTASYQTHGSLDMLTVTIAGNRESPPSWFEVANAWLDPSKAVTPIDEIYPKGVTVDQSNQQSKVDMTNSQKEAIAAALSDLGYTFTSVLTVVDTAKGYPADGLLKSGDIVKTVNGRVFPDVTGLRKEIAANGTTKAAKIAIIRDGEPMTISITPVLTKDKKPVPVVGITVQSEYSFPITVKIQLENVGGPSAGMMFALGIIDKLTPGDLNGGQQVAGTGTIDASGNVGPIGGIRQKLYGALDAGAKWFLAPSQNCDEVTGHIPQGLTVYSVSTLKDSLAALKAISTGIGRSSLPTCPTK